MGAAIRRSGLNNIFSKYCDVINLFDNTIRFQLTFENQNRSKAKLVKTVQIPEQDDDFNSIRKEYSEMLTDKLLKGSNGQSARKFLTFGIESTSYKAARAKLISINTDKLCNDSRYGSTGCSKMQYGYKEQVAYDIEHASNSDCDQWRF